MTPDVDARDVEAALRSLAPAGVRTGARLIDPRDTTGLFPVEAAAVERAVDRRRHEFASGRALLRRLLDADVPIPVRPDRSPELPDGVTASLAHDADLAVAALSRDRRIAALGIDVEPSGPALADDVTAIILRPDEAGLDPRLGFTLKEAVYKAWSTGGGELIDFHAVRLTVDGDRFRGEVVATGGVFDGRYAAAAGRWLALVVVEDGQLSRS
ncbi:MAG: 4'-phosphopantetheinyl transferase superfamily protein [Ilumatobacteraceae bacterium]